MSRPVSEVRGHLSQSFVYWVLTSGGTSCLLGKILFFHPVSGSRVAPLWFVMKEIMFHSAAQTEILGFLDFNMLTVRLDNQSHKLLL